MNRIMIIGNAGAGKSTLSRRLAARLGLPAHSIDKIYWRPGWRPAPEAEFRAAHDAILSQGRWVIDGYGPWFSVEQRLAVCDAVIFIDLPLRTHMWWAAKRQVKSLFHPNPDAPEGCSPWRVTQRLYRMIWRLHVDTKPKLIGAIYNHADTVRITHIRSVRELNDFTANPDQP